MQDNLKTILKYIQTYTECDNYTLSKISLLFDEYPIERIKIQKVEIEKKEFIREYEDINKWTEKYLINNNITYEDLTANNRKYHTVSKRVHFSKAAREYGFILTDIAKKLKMHHTSIMHLLNNYKP